MHTSLINHNSDKEKVNAKIQWNLDMMNNPEWLEQSPEYWLYGGSNGAGLHLDIVATRDISPDEEVYLDYGTSWEQAWQNHVSNWAPPLGASEYRPAFELNDDHHLILNTMDEKVYDGNLLELKCHEFYRVVNGKEPLEDFNFMHHCRPLARTQHRGENGDFYSYIVIVYYRFENDGDDHCWEEPMEVLFDLPRDAFFFVDVPYTRDIHQLWAFRHPIGIPDDIMPEAWLDL